MNAKLCSRWLQTKSIPQEVHTALCCTAAAEANWLSAHRVSGPPSTVLEHYGIAAHMSCTSDTSIGLGGGIQGDTEALCGEGVDLTQTHKLGTDILYLQYSVMFI